MSQTSLLISNSKISLNEARKLLGAKSKRLSDNQVQEIIDILTNIAREYLNKDGSKK